MSNFATYEQLLEISNKISKKVPQGIMLGNTPVGHIEWQMYLQRDYLKLDGTPLANASNDYDELLKFAQDNSLITSDTTDKSLFKYDSTNDVLTLPDYALDSGEVGSILSYMGNNVPIGCLACDGTIYNITDYPDLAEHINIEFGSYNYFGGDGTTTFAVPDLRGEFLRGSGTNSHTSSNGVAQGSGANVGVHQDATEAPVINSYSATASTTGSGTLSIKFKPDGSTNALKSVDSSYGTTTAVWSDINVTKQSVSTTNPYNYTYTSRPTNTSVLYCIRYKTTLIPQIKYKKSTTVWETIDIGRFVATSPVYYERAELPTPNKTTITIHNTWVNINGKGYVLEGEKVIDLTNSDNWDDSQYTVASNRAGKDFYIYACEPISDVAPKFILSANSTVPTGYTADTSRKIGGFHCLCLNVGTISNHMLSGYLTGETLPYSVWDLNHRAVSENEGMVWIPQINLWGDIYLSSWDGSKLVSVYNGVPVTGVSTKAMHGLMFAEELGKVNKFLPSYDEFIVLAKGSPEGDHISTGASPAGTGGHIATGGQRIISDFGLEDCVGVLWQWSKDTVEYTPGSTWNSNNYYLDGLSWQDKPVYNPTVDTVKRGSCFGLLRRLLLGGLYGDALALCGSRAASCFSFGSRLAAYLGCRGFCGAR